MYNIIGDGKSKFSGELSSLQLEPGESKSLTFNLFSIIPEPGVEYFLLLEVKTETSNNLIPKDHLIAWEQFRLPISRLGAPLDPTGLPIVNIERNNNLLFIYTDNFKVLFDTTNGFISGYEYRNEILLDS